MTNEIEKKLNLITKIINSCENVEQLEVVRNWIRVTSYWLSDYKLLRTCFYLISAADTDEILEGPNFDYSDIYECQELYNEIQIKRGIVKNPSPDTPH